MKIPAQLLSNPNVRIARVKTIGNLQSVCGSSVSLLNKSSSPVSLLSQNGSMLVNPAKATYSSNIKPILPPEFPEEGDVVEEDEDFAPTETFATYMPSKCK